MKTIKKVHALVEDLSVDEKYELIDYLLANLIKEEGFEGEPQPLELVREKKKPVAKISEIYSYRPLPKPVDLNQFRDNKKK